MGRPKKYNTINIDAQTAFDDYDSKSRFYVDFDTIVKTRSYSHWLTRTSSTPFYPFNQLCSRTNLRFMSPKAWFEHEDREWENIKNFEFPFGILPSRKGHK